MSDKLTPVNELSNQVLGDTPAKRDENGRFVPGFAGGPGRRKMDPKVREMLLAATPDAVKRLVEALDATNSEGESDHDVRIKAANALLDRIYGKPVQAVTGEDGGPVVVQYDVLGMLRKITGGE